MACLGLEGGESVLESFACTLLQTYTATSNFFTPPRQVRRLRCLGWRPAGLPGGAGRRGAAQAAARPAGGLGQAAALRPRLPASWDHAHFPASLRL